VTPVLAEESKIDMTKLSCKQFAEYDKDNMSVIMMRLEGYYTDENGEAVIGFNGGRHRASPRLLRRSS
jgi:hypothetical protein